MRRKSILILCTLNAVIAGIILIICLPRLFTAQTTAVHTPPKKERAVQSDAELWEQALTASHAREISYTLNQIQDRDYLRTQIEQQFSRLSELPTQPPTPALTVNDLQRYNTLIDSYSRLVKLSDESNLLIPLQHHPNLPITLRDTLLRSWVQACVTDYKATPSTETLAIAAHAIDQAYSERQTSLSGIALRADWFLQQNEMLTDERLIQLQQRIRETLERTDSLATNRLAAIELLQAPIHHSAVSNETLYPLYASTDSDAIKEALLTVLTAKADPSTKAWLSDQTASSPKLEQLQLTALEALQEAEGGSGQKSENRGPEVGRQRSEDKGRRPAFISNEHT